MEKEIDRLENEGIIHSISYSEWASPIVIVPKTNGDLRLCGDFKNTENPVIENEDLTLAYLQVELDRESKKYMVINMSKGLKQYNKMPYGVKPATRLFQRFLESSVCHIPKTVVRVDDILVSGCDDADHLKNLEDLFEILLKIEAKVNKKNCCFFAPEVEYIGFIINKDGYRINPEKIKALREIPEAKSVKELQSFLGGINYYARFILKMADIAHPLYKLLEKGRVWRWSGIEASSLELLKTKLSEAPVLCLNDVKRPLVLACDASYYGIGAVLSHTYPDGVERPITFVSRTLNKHKVNYSQVDKEGLAVIFAVKKFKQYLLGGKFMITIDNRAICWIFNPSAALSCIATA